MADVGEVAKEKKMRRSTTFSDSPPPDRPPADDWFPRPSIAFERKPLHSPTRRQNAQPHGLVYQNPYNRYNQVFGIWNPNMMIPFLRCYQTLHHLRRTNFTCKHDPELLAKRMIPIDSSVPVKRLPPEIPYSRYTSQRSTYQWPAEVPEKFRNMVKTTRFGHCPHNQIPAVGIVPNVLTIDCIGRPDVDTNLHPGLGGSGSKHGDGANSEYLPPIPGGSASGVVAQA